ncbi:DUF5052 family protein [Lacrimispora amygdalina]|uniref:DUF5052 family protein n=1 Tax=Lacrimispora amygdalina TaxID=253257 RepID=UPI000BE2A21A|nr:DUF5052 family protein [Lacrimispora amygdalina]
MLRKRIKLLLGALLMGVMLTGCSSFNMAAADLEAKLKGLDVIIRTFDEESQVIDKVKGKSVMIERDTTFDTVTSEGSNKDSSVIKISIGKNVMHHVGSSLIMAEDGLQDIFEEYAKTVDVTNTDRSVPFINSMVDTFKNVTTGKAKTILIRSQNGTPLATYLGNEVSIFSPDIPKTTVLLVDGQVLLIYRCDYTIYDTALLLE